MKRYSLYVVCVLFVVAVLAAGTNPTEKDYLEYAGPAPENISIERIDFHLFSTYAPYLPEDEYGIVHLGFMGMFFQISEGQYDYPEWLEHFRECACGG